MMRMPPDFLGTAPIPKQRNYLQKGGGALSGPAIRPAVHSLVRKAEIAVACLSAEARLGAINADLGPV